MGFLGKSCARNITRLHFRSHARYREFCDYLVDGGVSAFDCLARTPNLPLVVAARVNSFRQLCGVVQCALVGPNAEHIGHHRSAAGGGFLFLLVYFLQDSFRATIKPAR